MRTAVLLILLTLFIPLSESNAQIVEKKWQSLGDFPHGVECIYFLDLPGPPRIGFVGDSGSVYRTTDGGVTWLSVFRNDSILPSDFVFQNPDTGWFANFRDNALGNYHGIGAPVYKTTDGGLNWKPLNLPASLPTSIYYNKSNGLLLVSAWDGSTGGELYSSTDRGTSWSVLLSGSPFSGFAFMNPDSGVVTLRDNGAYRTTDGGRSWLYPFTLPPETWQADPDTIRRIIWEPSERGSNRKPDQSLLFKTTNFGYNFNFVETTPAITGTMREGSCGTLYMQTTSNADKNDHGILQSSDALSWTPLRDSKGNSGPSNIFDTRFYVKGDFVYSGGSMPDDSTSRLWRYVADSTHYGDSATALPKVSTKNFHMVSTNCLNLDSSIYVIYHNDCIPALLVSASLAPTDKFALNLHDTLPHETSGFYPLNIEHIPDSRIPDTTELYLHYYANGQDLYDTVLVSAQILGANISAPFDIVANGVMNATVAGGDTVVFTIQLTDSIPASLGLDSIGFSTMFDSNVLTFDSASAVAPWTLLREAHSNGTETLVLEPPTGQTAIADTAIVHIFYIADVAPNPSTSYIISDIHLNEASFDGCAGVASLPTPPMVTVVGCGDTILRNVMAGEPIAQLLGVESVNGAPVLSVRLDSALTLECDVFNEIGERVSNSSATEDAGIARIALPEDNLSSGTYFVTLRSQGREILSTHFTIKR